MATQVQLRRGTSTENNSFTGAQGELTFDTTNKRVRVHDGGQAGGFVISTADASGNVNIDGTVTADGLTNSGSYSSSGNAVFSVTSGASNVYIGGGGVLPGEVVYQAQSNHIFQQGGSEAMRIDSNGRIIQGRSSNTVRVDSGGTNAVPEVLFSRDSTGTSINNEPPVLTLLNDSSTLTANRMARLSFAAISNNLSLPIHSASITSVFTSGASGNGVSSDLAFATTDNTVSQSPTERMRIDSSGNVGIGTDAPSQTLSVNGFVRLGDDAGSILDIRGSATSADGILLSSTYYGTGGFGPIKFNTSNTEAMRIDSSGNLLVGKTSSDAGVTAGLEYHEAFGVLYVTDSGGESAVFNRLSSDGDIVRFRKDGSTVGSIGTSGSGTFEVIAETANFHLRPNGGTTSTGNVVWSQANVQPWNDNYYDVGSSSYRFKDLYLSGGVYLGGTGSANKLDDYETGTWLPGVEFASPGGTATTAPSSYTTGSYTKVGNVVTVEFNISGITFGNGTGNLQLTGLPFSLAGIAAYSGKLTASSGYLTSAHTASGYAKTLKLYGVSALIIQYTTEAGTAWTNITNSNASTVSPNSINGQFTYHTNA